MALEGLFAPSLEQFQLLWRIGPSPFFRSHKEFHVRKLTISYRENDDFSLARKDFFDPFDVNGCIFTAVAMADVDRILQHGKAILLQ